MENLIGKKYKCVKEDKWFSFKKYQVFVVTSYNKDKGWFYDIFIEGCDNDIKCYVNEFMLKDNFEEL